MGQSQGLVECGRDVGCCNRDEKGGKDDEPVFAVTVDEHALRVSGYVMKEEDEEQGKVGSSPERQPVNEMLFPMYVVPYKDFLAMEQVQAQQDLQKAGVLKEFSPSMGHTLFVSHQWVGAAHPDPGFEQLACLQQALKNLLDGSAEVALTYFDAAFGVADERVTAADLLARPLFIWYDYFSIPQIVARGENQNVDQDLGMAVDSIPAYIEMSEFFFILAPHCLQEDTQLPLDYQTWRERGWCRAERAARMLAVSKKRMTIVTSPHNLQAVDSLESYLASVGNGQFTVEGDKARIAPFVQNMLRRKLETIEDKRSHKYRLFSCLRFKMMAGLPAVAANHRLSVRSQSSRVRRMSRAVDECWLRIDNFLEELGFADARAHEAGCWTPLCYAACAGSWSLMKQLLDAKADPNEGTGEVDSLLMLSTGSLPSDICALLSHNEALEMLLELQVKEDGIDEAHLKSALFNCAFVDNAEGISILQRYGADIRVRNEGGASLVSVATSKGCPAVLETLLKSVYGRKLCENDSAPPLHLAMFTPNTTAVVKHLVNARANVNKRDQWPDRDKAAIRRCRAQSFGDGEAKDLLCRIHYFWEGATPLVMAVAAGKLETVELLLEAKAHLHLRNKQGKTAADVAEFMQFPAEMLKRLQC
eukprot:TRINITY_DN41638_c0_g1_i1.p1 TRINITY_DN41638_c0_g1~~TRINITY_DN41638_c0_g1_i1.p1  ORF type:complete len:646 (-),score=107.59 TRINITY_DN41638_c0_g1_i1:366-2303(-)